MGFKSLKEKENESENEKHERSKYQSEIGKCEYLFDDILVDDIEKNTKKINLEFDDPKSNREAIDDIEEILKFENFINDKILDRSCSVYGIHGLSRVSSIDIIKKNIHSDLDEVFLNLNEKERKDMFDHDRYTQSFCEDLCEAFERHFEELIKKSEIHSLYNQINFNEFNDDRKDRFCRFCVIKKVNFNKK